MNKDINRLNVDTLTLKYLNIIDQVQTPLNLMVKLLTDFNEFWHNFGKLSTSACPAGRKKAHIKLLSIKIFSKHLWLLGSELEYFQL